jgi:hypothetical protein
MRFAFAVLLYRCGCRILLSISAPKAGLPNSGAARLWPPERLDGYTAKDAPPLKAADPAQQKLPPEPLDGKTAGGEPPYKEWTQAGRRGQQSCWQTRSPLAGRMIKKHTQSGRRGLQTQATRAPAAEELKKRKQSAYGRDAMHSRNQAGGVLHFSINQLPTSIRRTPESPIGSLGWVLHLKIGSLTDWAPSRGTRNHK